MSDPDDASNAGGSDDGGPGDEELAEMADDLSDVLRDLRDELRASREARGVEPVEQPTGSTGGGVPDVSIDLPSATDVLAFTDEKLIPAAITVLEVNIRALELLQKGIRWARPDRAGENARAVQAHAESVSRSTLERLDGVLADLQDAASEGALPENAEASGIITEARRLRDEIDTALEERAEARGDDDEPDALPGDVADEADGEADDPPSPWGDQPEVDVDVEGELESIKAELGKDDDVDEESSDAEDEQDDAADRSAGATGADESDAGDESGTESDPDLEADSDTAADPDTEDESGPESEESGDADHTDTSADDGGSGATDSDGADDA